MSSFRQLMMRNKGGGGAYTELEYIQSTASLSQYIDTGIIGSGDLKLEIDFSMLATTGSRTLFAGNYGWQQKMFGCLVSGSQLWFYYNTNTNQYYFGFTNGSRYKIVCNKNICQLFQNDSQVWSYQYSYASFNSGETIKIFANSYSLYQEIGEFSSTKLYSCKIYDTDGNLIRDFIPVRRDADNVACLWDKVTQQYFENQGSGSFIGSDE